MKLFSLTTILMVLATCSAFSSSFTGSSVSKALSNQSRISMEYIPSGMSKDQWRKMKEAEQKKSQGRNLGKVGITTFKSQSFAAWQKAGGKNLFPVDPTKVKNKKDLPYMQRPGGSPDDSDLSSKGGNPLQKLFGGFGKKEEVVEEEEPPKTNWWTL